MWQRTHWTLVTPDNGKGFAYDLRFCPSYCSVFQKPNDEIIQPVWMLVKSWMCLQSFKRPRDFIEFISPQKNMAVIPMEFLWPGWKQQFFEPWTGAFFIHFNRFRMVIVCRTKNITDEEFHRDFRCDTLTAYSSGFKPENHQQSHLVALAIHILG